jgi:hypothetical protein
VKKGNTYRILFVVEGNSPWILDAYKELFNHFAFNTSLEIYCTTALVNDTETINAYNFIDYRRINRNALGFIDLIGIAELNIDSQYLENSPAIWSSPQKIAERLIEFKVIFSILQPDVVIVWNGMGDIRKVIMDFVKSQPVISYFAEKGLLPGSWCIDPVGINFTCSLDQNSLKPLGISDIKSTEDYIASISGRGLSAWSQPGRQSDAAKLKEELKITHYKKIIFFPAQVDNDINITQFSTFNDCAEAIELVLKNLPPDTVLIVKLHPKAEQKSEQRIFDFERANGNIKIVKNYNIWDLIGIADVVVSINSTVAFEALLNKTKLILLGQSILSKMGLVPITDKKEYPLRIEEVLYISFDDIINYHKVIELTTYLKEEYYIFKNGKSFQPFQHLVDILTSPKLKVFSKSEIWSILYKKNPAAYKKIYGRKKAVIELVKIFLGR